MALDIIAAGEVLSQKGLVERYEDGFRQIDSRCYEIACELSEILGYNFPPIEVTLSIVFKERIARLGMRDSPLESMPKSEGRLVVRGKTDSVTDHVTLKVNELEYNYGVGDAEGYIVEMEIPLTKKK
ncbi:MAG: hypothetical protein AABW73_02470 [Nanoarchaeota archaeon]